MTPVWAVEVPDRPAGLSELLQALSDAHVDVEYMYSLFTHKNDCAYMVLRVSDDTKFRNALSAQGIKVMGKADLGLK